MVQQQINSDDEFDEGMSLERSQGVLQNDAKRFAAFRCTFDHEDAEDTENDYAYGFRYCDGNDP